MHLGCEMHCRFLSLVSPRLECPLRNMYVIRQLLHSVLIKLCTYCKRPSFHNDVMFWVVCHNNYVHLRMILMRLLTADYSMLLTIRRNWPTIQLIQQMIVIGCRLINNISSHDQRVAIHFNVDTCEVMHMGFAWALIGLMLVVTIWWNTGS